MAESLLGQPQDSLDHHRDDGEHLGTVLLDGAQVSSGSKRRRSTIVDAVGRLITKWKKPQEWKSGAAITIVSRAR